MSIKEIDPKDYGDFPANIEFMPGERRVSLREQGANLAGIQATLESMIDNGHDVISILAEGAKENSKTKKPYIIDGAELSSLGPEGQVLRWWKRPRDWHPRQWVKDHKQDIVNAVKDHKKEIVEVAGATATVAAVAIDVLYHIRHRKSTKKRNGKNTNNTH